MLHGCIYILVTLSFSCYLGKTKPKHPLLLRWSKHHRTAVLMGRLSASVWSAPAPLPSISLLHSSTALPSLAEAPVLH